MDFAYSGLLFISAKYAHLSVGRAFIQSILESCKRIDTAIFTDSFQRHFEVCGKLLVGKEVDWNENRYQRNYYAIQGIFSVRRKERKHH